MHPPPRDVPPFLQLVWLVPTAMPGLFSGGCYATAAPNDPQGF